MSNGWHLRSTPAQRPDKGTDSSPTCRDRVHVGDIVPAGYPALRGCVGPRFLQAMLFLFSLLTSRSLARHTGKIYRITFFYLLRFISCDEPSVAQ
jgi:hypothetical protein